MKRGDIVTISASGDYGKPRPAVVIQSDWLKSTDSVLVALMTSTLVDAPLYRLSINPSDANGLKMASQIMVDKILAIPRANCGRVVGSLDTSALIALNAMLLAVIGAGD